MRHVNKDNLTEVFNSYMGTGVSPRLREVMTSMVTHLHDFAKEVNLTHSEWEQGISFLERAGEISNKERHEFVLLSDVLGFSSLIDMINSDENNINKEIMRRIEQNIETN